MAHHDSEISVMRDPSSPVELVESAYRCLFSGNIEGFLSCLSADCVVHEAESLPYGGDHRGHDDIRRLIDKMTELWQDFRFDVEEIVAGRSTVIAYGEMTIVGRKTGRTASFPLVEHWRIENGKAAAITAVYGDTVLARDIAGEDGVRPEIGR